MKHKELLEYIVENAPGHIYWYDKNNVFLGCNKQQALDAGLSSSDEIVGKTNAEMPWKDQGELLDKTNNDVIKYEKTIIREEPSILANGEKRYFLSKKQPLRDENDNIVGVLGTSLDITEQKKAIWKSILKVVSNRLRGPIGDIENICETVLTDGITNFASSYDDCFTMIKACIAKLKSLIHVEAEYLPLLQEDIDKTKGFFAFNKLMQKIISHYSDKPNAIMISLNSSHPNLEIYSSVSILEKIFSHLIDNAVHYTEKGQVRVDVQHQIDNNGGECQLQVTIADTGCGISQEKLTYIDQLFTSDEIGLANQFGGLRLSLCRLLLEKLNSSISIESKLDKGTTVKVVLNIEKTQHSNEHNQPLKALMVADDKISAKILAYYLTSLNCKVIAAENGSQAIAAIDKHDDFDVAFIDISLPDMSGVTLVNKLRHKMDKKIPFIAVTAHGSEEEKESYIDAGLDDVLVKPVYKDTLREVISDLQAGELPHY